MNLIDTRITKAEPTEAMLALRDAWKRFYGCYPGHAPFTVVLAHIVRETGLWMIRNYNVGNIKVGSSWDGDYCMYTAGERIGGRYRIFEPPHRQTWFRSYPTLTEGLVDYLRFMASRESLQEAWKEVLAGDPRAYCRRLKDARYYTATLEEYTELFIRIYDKYLEIVPTVIGDPSLTAEQLEAIDGQIAVSLDRLAREVIHESENDEQ